MLARSVDLSHWCIAWMLVESSANFVTRARIQRISQGEFTFEMKW